MNRSTKAVYPGSFDPPTLGHLDVIQRASKLFESLTILIAESPRKSPMFTVAERREILSQCIKDLPNVTIDSHDGLTVDYVRSHGCHAIVRGLRAVSDFEYEFQMATMNRKLAPDIETVIMMTGESFYYISSNTVKEVAIHGGDVTKLVPAPAVLALKKKLRT